MLRGSASASKRLLSDCQQGDFAACGRRPKGFAIAHWKPSPAVVFRLRPSSDRSGAAGRRDSGGCTRPEASSSIAIINHGCHVKSSTFWVKKAHQMMDLSSTCAPAQRKRRGLCPRFCIFGARRETFSQRKFASIANFDARESND